MMVWAADWLPENAINSIVVTSNLKMTNRVPSIMMKLLGIEDFERPPANKVALAALQRGSENTKRHETMPPRRRSSFEIRKIPVPLPHRSCFTGEKETVSQENQL